MTPITVKKYITTVLNKTNNQKSVPDIELNDN